MHNYSLIIIIGFVFNFVVTLCIQLSKKNKMVFKGSTCLNVLSCIATYHVRKLRAS